MKTATETTFPARRSPFLATHFMVATSQPLASRVGFSVLREGGNAADAAVAIAAALNVTEPTSTGLGGDCFALYYEGRSGNITALNASGRAPAALTLELVAQQGLDRTWDPLFRHAHTVTVPGACSGWAAMLERHGTMSLKDVLAPAIELAEEGVPVGPVTSAQWEVSASRELQAHEGSKQFLINGRAPRPGERFCNPNLARTMRTIAEGGPKAFYHGEIARAIAETVQEAGGVMTVEDLAAHEATWETPISTVYRGVRVWECPPNGQGLAALLALNVMAGLPEEPRLSPARLHEQIEAMRLAFADTNWYVADPAFCPAPVQELLSARYAATRRQLFNPSRAQADVRRGAPIRGSDTVYFCVVDEAGNACSFINSNFGGFGTGLVPPGCGFSLQNRGANFVMERGHPNALAPRKRPYHTIIPGLMTRPDGSLFGPFGVMGGFMQPQGHLQVAVALLDDELDPQTALEQPRFRVAGDQVFLEPGLPAAELAALGHQIEPSPYGHVGMGRGQVIVREPDGVLWAGSDPRADGCAMGW